MKRNLVLLAILSLSALAAGGAQRPRWPLDAERRLSSSFLEYRDGHYHAGIDLRTFGRIGLPCRAIDDGEAIRLRSEPKGYGKAVYLRTADGRVAVYAHLNGFCRSLDSLAYVRRLELGANSCDLEIPPGTFVFRRGEIVGYTGSTGSLHPHLHFELRDPAGRPIDPLGGVYEVPDDCPPILSGLAVVPRRWGSLVDGSPLAATRRFRLVPGGRYAVRDTLVLEGEFAFGVSAYDKQSRGSYRMGLREVELRIDGAVAYRLRNDVFDYAQVNDVALEYEERGGEAAGRYLVLYRKPANAIPHRDGEGVVSNLGSRPGVRGIEPGPHEGEIVARDAAGNEARGVFRFVMLPFGASARDAVAAAPPETAGAGAAADAGEAPPGAEIRCELRAEGLYARVRATAPFGGLPEVSVPGDATGREIAPLPLGPDECVALLSLDRFAGGGAAVRARGRDARGRSFDATRECRLLVFETGARRSFAAGEDLVVSLDAPGVRGTSAVVVRKADVSGGRKEGLVPVGSPFALEYPAEGFSRWLLAGFDAGRRAGLYRWGGRAGWTCVGVPAIEPGGRVEVRRPGTYAVLTDTKAPELRALGSTRKGSQSGFFKARLRFVPVRETGSGVDARSAIATLDGRRIVCEWDEYRGRLLLPVPRSRPPGPATFRVEIADRAGNTASAEYAVVLE